MTDESSVRPYNPEARDAEGRPLAPDFTGWGATSFYQMARPSNEEMDEMLKSDTQRAAQEFLGYVEQVAKQRSLPPEQAKILQEQAKIRAAEVAGGFREAYSIGKCYASYWLGELAMERGNYPSAIDYFANRTLAVAPDSPWADGAHYNLARAYEATGQREKAIQEYQAVGSSPSAYGNALRARWLKEQKR